MPPKTRKFISIHIIFCFHFNIRSWNCKFQISFIHTRYWFGKCQTAVLPTVITDFQWHGATPLASSSMSQLSTARSWRLCEGDKWLIRNSPSCWTRLLNMWISSGFSTTFRTSTFFLHWKNMIRILLWSMCGFQCHQSYFNAYSSEFPFLLFRIIDLMKPFKNRRSNFSNLWQFSLKI